jgi:hypothetical protein
LLEVKNVHFERGVDGFSYFSLISIILFSKSSWSEISLRPIVNVYIKSSWSEINLRPIDNVYVKSSWSEINLRPIDNVLCKIKLVYVKFSKFCI